MGSINSIARTLAWLALFVAALVVFPNRIPEFAGLLLLVGSWGVWNNDRWFMLAIVPIWLAIKWPLPTISLGAFVVSVVGVIVYRQFEKKDREGVPNGDGRGDSGHRETREANSRKRWGLTLLLPIWLFWLLWLADYRLGAVRPTRGFEEGAGQMGPIVCLGDSLTDYGYPDDLQRLVNRKVVDFGVSGYTTDDGIERIAEIKLHKPSIVILELGGHDYNQRETRSRTYKNLQRLIDEFREIGAEVVLVEIPRGFINDPWYGIERQLAREYDLQLVPDTMVRRLIYWSPILPPGLWVETEQHLSVDGLHPNHRGNQMMARTIADALPARMREE